MTEKFFTYENIAYGTHPQQTLDLCLPRDKTKTGLILWIHGGSWIMGDKADYRDQMTDCCARLGYASASINYRLLSENVRMCDILDDITAALTVIRQTAERDGICLTGMLLTGHSAGGHLAELYAYKCAGRSPIPPRAVAAQAGPADLTDENVLFNNALGSAEQLMALFSNACGQPICTQTLPAAHPALAAISPVYFVTPDSVPTLLAHGKKDSVVPYAQAVALSEKLTACGVRHDFVTYPDSGHALKHDPDSASREKTLFEQYADAVLD